MIRAAWVLVLIGLVVGAALGRPWLERRRHPRPRFEYSRGALSAAGYAELVARPGWSAAALPVAPDVSLRGLVKRPPAPGGHWVVFFAGNDATMLARGQRVLDTLGEGKDWGLAVYAYRGYDSSPGSLGPQALAADALRIVDSIVKGERADPSRVHLVAFSLGGYAALAAAGQAASAGARLGSVSLMASVREAEMVGSPWAARVMLGDFYDVSPFLASVPGPVLVVHGSKDEALGPGTGKEIAALLGARCRYVEVPGAGHQLTDDASALQAVREMIERTVSTPGS